MRSQQASFLRWGCSGDFARPYATMQPEYVCRQLELFARLFDKGLIRRAEKPVYWCKNKTKTNFCEKFQNQIIGLQKNLYFISFHCQTVCTPILTFFGKNILNKTLYYFFIRIFPQVPQLPNSAGRIGVGVQEGLQYTVRLANKWGFSQKSNRHYIYIQRPSNNLGFWVKKKNASSNWKTFPQFFGVKSTFFGEMDGRIIVFTSKKPLLYFSIKIMRKVGTHISPKIEKGWNTHNPFATGWICIVICKNHFLSLSSYGVVHNGFWMFPTSINNVWRRLKANILQCKLERAQLVKCFLL